MASACSTQQFRDEYGFEWTFEAVFTEAGMETFVSCSARCVERTRLLPATPNTSRPSVDSDVPLPLESL